MIFFAIKVAGLALLLRYLRVLDVQSIAAFAGASFFLFLAYGAANVPELIIFSTMAVFFAWITVLAFLKNFHKIRELKFGVQDGIKYAEFFSAMFVILFFMIKMLSSLDGVLLYAGAILFYFALVFAREMFYGHLKKYPLLSYRYAFFAVAAYSAFFDAGLLFRLAGLGAGYVALFMLYETLYASFTSKATPGELAPGMVLAEHIVKKGKKYMKSSVIFFTPFSVLRNMFSNKVRGYEVVFGSFQPLSAGDIKVMKKIMGTYSIDHVRVQRTVDIRPFLLMGVILVLFSIKTGFKMLPI